MKRTLLLTMTAAMLALGIQARADRRPMLEQGKTWYYTYHHYEADAHGYDDEHTTWTVTYTLRGDTTIAGQQYMKMYRGYKDEHYFGAYREDEEGRVYMLRALPDAKEELVIDFNLNYENAWVKDVQPIVETINVNGKEFRRYKYKELPDIVGVEGVGFQVVGLNSPFVEHTTCICDYEEFDYVESNGFRFTNADFMKSNDYIPFVEMNKGWEVVISYDAPYYGGSFSEFGMEEEVERDGKTYVHAKRVLIAECEVQEAGLFREENRRVYKYDEKTGKDIMMYDFSLKEGDTFTYEFGFDQPVNCKVLKQGWLTDGPQIATSCTLTSDGTLDIEYRSLHTWTIGRDNGSGEYEEMATWVECIGALENVFGLIDNGFRKFDYSLAFLVRKDNETSYDKNRYLPFSFCDKYMHGCNLPTGEEELAEDTKHHLTYELEGDRLHVYGDVFTQCGPYNYAYFYERKTDDPLVHTIEFMPWEVLEVADCMSLRATDFYVPGFDPDLKYIVIDNRGEEHAVINKMAYRPMIEEGKVWKVGSTTGIRDGIVKMVEYYYFDGDTIIDGKTCKQMMRQRYVSPNHPDYAEIMRFPLTSSAGAWYEEDKKVYAYNTSSKQFTLMYDFSLGDNETLQINNNLYVVGPKQTGEMKGFKGVYRDVMMKWDGEESIYNTTWLEGVGGIDGPTVSVYLGKENHVLFLMSCTVDDEVIYLKDEYEDGATPEAMEAKKHRFDFTHTVKNQPKAPIKRVKSDAESSEMQSLYGEYNDLQLDINLDPLDEAYIVRITNESGNVVYEKAINAGSIVALSIDISAYAKGRYTVTVENSSESFSGEFDTQTTGIIATTNKKEEIHYIYNLQGKRLSSLQKGLNIVDGRKIIVK